MARIGEDAPVAGLLHVEEIVYPVLQDGACALKPRTDALSDAHELEVREIVERPAYRHFDQTGGRAEAHRRVDGDHIARAGPVRKMVVPHHKIGRATGRERVCKYV